MVSDDHPHLDVRVAFPTRHGGRDLRIKGAVADTGAQVNIFPERLIRESGLQLIGVTTSRIPAVKSAGGAKVSVSGVVKVHVAAMLTSGEVVKAATEVYIANIADFYLLYNTLRGLNVVECAGHEAMAVGMLLGVGIQQMNASTAPGNERAASGDTPNRRCDAVLGVHACVSEPALAGASKGGPGQRRGDGRH